MIHFSTLQDPFAFIDLFLKFIWLPILQKVTLGGVQELNKTIEKQSLLKYKTAILKYTNHQAQGRIN